MSFFQGIRYFITGIGLYKVGEVAYTLGSEVYFRQLKERQELTQRYGQCYALVTDSTEDLGAAYAGQLAQNKFNLVLVSKDKEELKRQSEALEANYGVKVTTIEFNSRKSNSLESFEKIYEQVKDLDIGVIVNNSEGFQVQKFDHQYPQEIQETINSNIISSTILLNTFIPKLLQRGERSCIINVGSEIGDIPAGYLSLLSATKAYNNTLSRALSQEFKDKIDIVTALPGPIATVAYNSLLEPKEGEELSYFKYLISSFKHSFSLSNPERSANETLSLVDSKTDIPGTKTHLLYYLFQKNFGFLPWTTNRALGFFENYGEKRTSNIAPKSEIKSSSISELSALYELSSYPKLPSEGVEAEELKQRGLLSSNQPIIPKDIVKTLSNDFLLPFITKDYNV